MLPPFCISNKCEYSSKRWSSTHESPAKLRSIGIGILLMWNISYLLMYFMRVFPLTVIVRVFTCGSFYTEWGYWAEPESHIARIPPKLLNPHKNAHVFGIILQLLVKKVTNIIADGFQDCWGTVTSQVSNSCVGTVIACNPDMCKEFGLPLIQTNPIELRNSKYLRNQKPPPPPVCSC
jgi:hypothetical protein